MVQQLDRQQMHHFFFFFLSVWVGERQVLYESKNARDNKHDFSDKKYNFTFFSSTLGGAGSW